MTLAGMITVTGTTIIVLATILVMVPQCNAATSKTSGVQRKRTRPLQATLPRGYIARMKNCLYKPGYRKINRKAELVCCDFWEKRFYGRWYGGNEYLTTFLEIMKSWECPQLTKHCDNRYFNFSPFTNVAYMRTCTNQAYREHCFDKVNDIASKHANGKHNSTLYLAHNITANQWRSMVYGLQSKDMSDDEIADPCVQVALYEGGRGGHGRYHETIRHAVPFCGIIWCGYDSDTVYSRYISAWRCMPTGCQVAVGVVAAIMICLGLAVLFANGMVMAVYWYRKRLNNSQIVYKVTLAVGDLLVGAVVLPTFVATMFLMYKTRNVMGDILGKDETINETWDGDPLLPRRAPSGYHVTLLSNSYVNTVGFFTTASFLLSLYTLMLASFDRMVAICFPMTFIRSKALKAAKYCCSFLVIMIFLIATIPIYVYSISYGTVASFLISLVNAVVVYVVLFLIPLLLVWISNIIIIIYSRKFSAIRRAISSATHSQIQSSERRLAKTLLIMVGAFSLSILPVSISLLVSVLVSNVHLNDPEKMNSTATHAFNTAEVIAAIILSTNSLWNYFIYGSRDKDFKQHSKAVTRAIADRLGLIYLWNRMNMSSRRRSTLSSLSSALTSLSVSKVVDANKNTCRSKNSITDDIQEPDVKRQKREEISLQDWKPPKTIS